MCVCVCVWTEIGDQWFEIRSIITSYGVHILFYKSTKISFIIIKSLDTT
jgi:hypothetical protein